MTGTDFVRAVLDLIDEIENKKIDVEVTAYSDSADPEGLGMKDSRFRQIIAMLNQEKPFPGSGATTEPNEIVADIDAVTTGAGGGVNGPKHPADIRVKDTRGYE